jgi:hypothetical protein
MKAYVGFAKDDDKQMQDEQKNNPSIRNSKLKRSVPIIFPLYHCILMFICSRQLAAERSTIKWLKIELECLTNEKVSEQLELKAKLEAELQRHREEKKYVKKEVIFVERLENIFPMAFQKIELFTLLYFTLLYNINSVSVKIILISLRFLFFILFRRASVRKMKILQNINWGFSEIDDENQR